MATANHITKYQKLWAEFVKTAKHLRKQLYTFDANDKSKTRLKPYSEENLTSAT